MKRNKLSIKIKKVLISGILGLLIFASPLQAKAFWGEFVQEGFHFTLLEIYDQINGLIMGSLKQEAVSMLNGQVDALISGSSGRAGFIVDWEDYLVTQPENNAKVYINDYLSQMTSGRGSLTGYRSEGFDGGGNYIGSLAQSAKATNESRDEIIKPTYEGDPSQMFEGGNFDNFNLYLSGVNNRYAFNMAVEQEYQKKLEEEKYIQETKANAYEGFEGTYGSDGKTVTYPGSLTKQNIADIQNLPNLITAAAQDPAEIITAAVSGMINKSMQQGFNSIQKGLQKTTSVQNNVQSEINKAVEEYGPGALYGN